MAYTHEALVQLQPTGPQHDLDRTNANDTDDDSTPTCESSRRSSRRNSTAENTALTRARAGANPAAWTLATPTGCNSEAENVTFNHACAGATPATRTLDTERRHANADEGLLRQRAKPIRS